MPSKKPSVLVVDDDMRVLRMMQRILELEGYQVLTASNGNVALDVFAEKTPDLVLLDIMMPIMDGYAVCHHIREFSQLPIIMVTAKGNDEEKLKGFDAGADDYLTKPFSSAELAARVKAVLRRATLQEQPSNSTFSSKDLVIDFARQNVILNGKQLNLTATEYRLLSCLARSAGRVLTLDQILEKVWGEEYLGETHLLQATIARLRRKIQDDARHPAYILTKPGIGYTMPKT